MTDDDLDLPTDDLPLADTSPRGPWPWSLEAEEEMRETGRQAFSLRYDARGHVLDQT